MRGIQDKLIGDIMSLFIGFFREVGMILVISTGVTVVNVAYFQSTLCALSLTSAHNEENSEIKISLKTYQGLDILTVPACC